MGLISRVSSRTYRYRNGKKSEHQKSGGGKRAKRQPDALIPKSVLIEDGVIDVKNKPNRSRQAKKQRLAAKKQKLEKLEVEEEKPAVEEEKPAASESEEEMQETKENEAETEVQPTAEPTKTKA